VGKRVCPPFHHCILRGNCLDIKKIYLDVCCFNRPFDDQTQERIKLETEAILLILKRFELGQWQWVSSETMDERNCPNT